MTPEKLYRRLNLYLCVWQEIKHFLDNYEPKFKAKCRSKWGRMKNIQIEEYVPEDKSMPSKDPQPSVPEQEDVIALPIEDE